MRHRYTAANTPILWRIRKIFNAKIYKHALLIYNSKGKDATLAYLQQFVTSDIQSFLDSFFTPGA